MKALVFYDETGRVWLIAHGETTMPPGALCMWVDIEDGVDLVRIDVTDPKNPKPVFSAQPDSEIGKLQKQMAEVQAQTSVNVLASTFAAETFTDEQALQVPTLYPTWEELVVKGYKAEKAGYRFRYQDQLYKTVGENYTFVSHYVPGVGTESIFTKIEESHAGTLEDPIPAKTNLEYVKGKYYIEDGVIYLMNREGMADGETIVLQFTPSQLVGQYFEVVTE